MDLAHVLRVVRALAFLPPIAAATTTGCSPVFPPGCDGFDQTQGATVPGGAPASASAAAQCATAGQGASCTEPVICGPAASCCGRWSCVPPTWPDAGAALVWSQNLCEGPLDPPESAA